MQSSALAANAAAQAALWQAGSPVTRAPVIQPVPAQRTLSHADLIHVGAHSAPLPSLALPCAPCAAEGLWQQ